MPEINFLISDWEKYFKDRQTLRDFKSHFKEWIKLDNKVIDFDIDRPEDAYHKKFINCKLTLKQQNFV